jgi:RNA polymerase sigma factor (sigma-70 family)
MATRDENEVFAEWRAAEGERKEELLWELEKLLRHHAHAVCWQQLQEHDQALVNGAVFRALHRQHQFRGEAKFSTWFEALVRRLCHTALRQKITQRNREVSLTHLEGTGAEPGVSEGPGVDARVEMQRLLETLSAKEQMILRQQLQGVADEETATFLGISKHTLQQRRCDLFKKLRKAV